MDLDGIACTAEEISIHSLRGEGDKFQKMSRTFIRIISIHSLRGEGDKFASILRSFLGTISIHSLRGEGDTSGMPII